MQTFPMFLKLDGRTVVIVGGGEDAARKCRLVLKTTARIELIAQAQVAELAAHALAGRIGVQVTPAPGLLAGAALVFIGTGCPGADAAWQARAKAEGAGVVNVVDQPALCDAFTPAIVDRDPVIVAIGTEGTAPVLARQIKSRIETMLEPGLGALAALAGRLRGLVEHRVPRPSRRAFWRWVFTDAPRRVAARDGDAAAEAEIRRGVEAGIGAPAALVSLIAAPDASDLVTLRAAARLQEADLIVHDPDLVDVLELARRDAVRLDRAEDDWEEAVADAVTAAQRVVVLVRSDPRAMAEALARLAGDALEILPDVPGGPHPAPGNVVRLR